MIWYAVPIYAVRVSNNDGTKPADVTSDQIYDWIDPANDVFQVACVRFTFDGQLHPLASSDFNGVTGEKYPQWDSVRDTLNAIAGRERMRWLSFGTEEDTPSDPFIRSIQCNADTTAVLNGQTFSLQRDNAMSYYYQADAASLSSDQVLRVRRILEQRLDDNSLTLLQDGSSNANWALGYKWSDFVDLHNDYLSRGWRLHHVNSYVIGGHVRFNGIWHEGNRYTRWALRYLRADFDTLNAQNESDGFYLTCLDTYYVDGTTRYNALWFHGESNSNNPIRRLYAYARNDSFDQTASHWAQGYKVREVNSHDGSGGQITYNGVFQKHQGTAVN